MQQGIRQQYANISCSIFQICCLKCDCVFVFFISGEAVGSGGHISALSSSCSSRGGNVSVSDKYLYFLSSGRNVNCG